MTKVSEVAAVVQDTVSFEYKGNSFTIERDLPAEFLEVLDSGRITVALKTMMGEDQYKTFMADKPRVSDVNGVIEAAMNAVGSSMGESKA